MHSYHVYKTWSLHGTNKWGSSNWYLRFVRWTTTSANSCQCQLSMWCTTDCLVSTRTADLVPYFISLTTAVSRVDSPTLKYSTLFLLRVLSSQQLLSWLQICSALSDVLFMYNRIEKFYFESIIIFASRNKT